MFFTYKCQNKHKITKNKDVFKMFAMYIQTHSIFRKLKNNHRNMIKVKIMVHFNLTKTKYNEFCIICHDVDINFVIIPFFLSLFVILK